MEWSESLAKRSDGAKTRAEEELMLMRAELKELVSRGESLDER